MEIPAAAGRRNRVEKDSATLREIDWNTRHGGLALLKLFHRACLPQAGVLGLFLANFHCIFFKCNRNRNNYFTEPQARFISSVFLVYFYCISTLLFLSLRGTLYLAYLPQAGLSNYTESIRSFTTRFQLCISL
jgi:hypothetical protein